MAALTPYLFAPELHSHLVPYLAALQGSCISHDRTISNFLPPLNHDKLLTYWKEKISEVGTGARVILILLEESDPGTKAKGTELKGVVMLSIPATETGPFRGNVESLLVSPKLRRQGAARLLIETLHIHAVQKGKTLMMADTETGSASEEVFKKFGYTEVGRVPRYSLSPSGDLKDATFFYKDLSSA